jgi:hypothetical protein
MSCWSYYKAATIKNDIIQRPMPPPDNREIDPIYKVNCLSIFMMLRILIRAKHVKNGNLSDRIIVQYAKHVF